MKRITIAILICPLVLQLQSCQKNANSNPTANTQTHSQEFNDYWYSGKAEIDSYNLRQARYGEVHEGKAVLIFVTEPFSKSKQVKLDNPAKAGKDNQTVLKLNFTKKFTTGIYPYSMMLSAFTPIDINNATSKVSMSSQEWCGHVYSQMNLQNDKYHLSSYSYFEKEGDVELDIDQALLEDEIWNRIRLNPSGLPLGEIELIPGLFHTRLLHKNLKKKKVNAAMSSKEGIKIYTLDYPEDKRKLIISFEENFPYKILGWTEQIIGLNGIEITTSATLDKTLRIDYWNRNGTMDGHFRDSLNLE